MTQIPSHVASAKLPVTLHLVALVRTQEERVQCAKNSFLICFRLLSHSPRTPLFFCVSNAVRCTSKSSPLFLSCGALAANCPAKVCMLCSTDLQRSKGKPPPSIIADITTVNVMHAIRHDSLFDTCVLLLRTDSSLPHVLRTIQAHALPRLLQTIVTTVLDDNEKCVT